LRGRSSREEDLRIYVDGFKGLIDEALDQRDREKALREIVELILPEAKKYFPPHLYREIREYAELRLGVRIDDDPIEKASKGSQRR